MLHVVDELKKPPGGGFVLYWGSYGRAGAPVK